jgi:hypothetical protein
MESIEYLDYACQCFLIKVFGVLVAPVDALRINVESKCSPKHLSNERRRPKGHEVVKLLTTLALVIGREIWEQHVIHIVAIDTDL